MLLKIVCIGMEHVSSLEMILGGIVFNLFASIFVSIL